MGKLGWLRGSGRRLTRPHRISPSTPHLHLLSCPLPPVSPQPLRFISSSREQPDVCIRCGSPRGRHPAQQPRRRGWPPGTQGGSWRSPWQVGPDVKVTRSPEGGWRCPGLIAAPRGLLVSPGLPGLAWVTWWARLLSPPALLFPEDAHSHLSPCATVFLGCPARFLHYSRLCQVSAAMPGSPLEVSPTRGDLGGGGGHTPPRGTGLKPSSPTPCPSLYCEQPSPTPSPPLPSLSCLRPTHSRPMAWPRVSPELPAATVSESAESPNLCLSLPRAVSRPRPPLPTTTSPD